MKAAVLHRAQAMRIEAVADPKIESPDEVLIKVGNVGVCGANCHFYEHGRIGDFASPNVWPAVSRLVESGLAIQSVAAAQFSARGNGGLYSFLARSIRRVKRRRLYL